jgi:hypothetical protein
MYAIAALRRLLARRPWLYWLLVAACVALVVWSVHRSERLAAQERAAWGATQTVWVTTEAIARGEPIRADAQHWPTAMMPANALTTEPAAPAAHALDAGEIVVTGDLATANEIGNGWAVAPVPRDLAPQTLAGDGVIVIGNGRTLCDGVVDATRDDTVEVAVPRACAPALAVHLGAGTLLLARVL